MARGNTLIHTPAGRGTTIARNTSRSFTEEDCSDCGLVFYLPHDWLQHRKNTGGTYYCPGCRATWTYNDNENARLKKQLKAETERAERAWREKWEAIDRKNTELKTERRSKAAVQGHLTRTKNRIAGGVCPCCNRTFVALGKHMKTKHPDYTKITEGEG